MTNLWRSLLSEFIGTFTLVFIGAGAVALSLTQGGTLLGSALAFGLILAAIVYIWGPFSGAHVNPAVSFGFWTAGLMTWWEMLLWWIAQLLGGLLAACLIAYFFGTADDAGASVGSFTYTDTWKALLVEAFITFFLVLTYLMLSADPKYGIIAGLAIGFVLAADMLMAGPLTGASTNPARTLGPALFTHNMGSYWIYVVGPLVGALVAALVYRLFHHRSFCNEPSPVVERRRTVSRSRSPLRRERTVIEETIQNVGDSIQESVDDVPKFSPSAPARSVTRRTVRTAV